MLSAGDEFRVPKGGSAVPPLSPQRCLPPTERGAKAGSAPLASVAVPHTDGSWNSEGSWNSDGSRPRHGWGHGPTWRRSAGIVRLRSTARLARDARSTAALLRRAALILPGGSQLKTAFLQSWNCEVKIHSSVTQRLKTGQLVMPSPLGTGL
ncbi:uncharacterized protein GJ701_000601 isoform 2-T2 [Geothlypis trichas]